MQERLYKTCMAFCIIAALFVQKTYTRNRVTALDRI